MSGVEHRRLRVYVAGPMSKGDFYDNVHLGIRIGRKVFEDGMAPYVPHLDAFMYMGHGQDGKLWNAFLEWDVEWVAQSEAVLRLPGESRGADLEVKHAERLGLPVFPLSSYDALLRYADNLGLRSLAKEPEDEAPVNRLDRSNGGGWSGLRPSAGDAGPDHPAITPVGERGAL